jgi:putative endonuclease
MNKTPLSRRGYYTYILECADGTYYCGWTTDPARRLSEHNSGIGSRYTRTRRPVRMVYLKSLPSRNEAMRMEAMIKKMPRRKKAELIRSVPDPDL